MGWLALSGFVIKALRRNNRVDKILLLISGRLKGLS